MFGKKCYSIFQIPSCDCILKTQFKLSALNLDNENIRGRCDALRRQCQDQGAAFGDLTKLVKGSLHGRPPQRPQTGTGRPHPIILADLIDDGGNFHAVDIGITWQGGDIFLHSVRVVGTNEDADHIRPRPATSTPYSTVREHPHVVCQHHGLHNRRVWKSLRHQHTEPARKDAQATDRRLQYSALIIKPSVGRHGFVILKPSLMSTDGTRTSEHCNSSRTSTRRR